MGVMHKAPLALWAVALSACVAAAAPMSAPGPSASSLKASQAAATANAVHPGDAEMSCDAIQAEFGALTNDPQYRAAIASMGARSADQKAKIDSAMANHSTKSDANATAAAQGTAADLEKIMPQIMRSQRLTSLGKAKSCAFLAGLH